MDQKSYLDFAVASGGGLTHAGLLSGPNARGFIGSSARRDAVRQRQRIRTVLDGIEVLSAPGKHVPSNWISTWGGALSPGNGPIGCAPLSATKMMAQSDGLILDPVYTAKVLAAIPALVEDGKIKNGSKVLVVDAAIGVLCLESYFPKPPGPYKNP